VEKTMICYLYIHVQYGQHTMALTQIAEQHTYRILISGHIPAEWASWFNGLELQILHATKLGAVTLIQGTISDQSQLRGILNRLWDLNLKLIAVYRMDQAQFLEEGFDESE
jgi:hypothetical protein